MKYRSNVFKKKLYKSQWFNNQAKILTSVETKDSESNLFKIKTFEI